MYSLCKPFESNEMAAGTIFRKMGKACLKIHRQSETSNSGRLCSGYLLVPSSCQLYKRSSHTPLPQLQNKRRRKSAVEGFGLGPTKPSRKFSFALGSPGTHLQPFALASFQELLVWSSLLWFLQFLL